MDEVILSVIVLLTIILVKSNIYINNLRYKAGSTYRNLYIISDVNYK